MALPLTSAPELIHPSLWRATQLARARGRCVDTGHPPLSAELPGGGWPVGSLTEMLVRQTGVGELRLLAPALRTITQPAGIVRGGRRRPVMMIAPPQTLQPLALATWGIDPSDVVILRPPRAADALWCTEQALRAGTCSAVLLWQQSAMQNSLRRLHLAAQTGDALFFAFRPQPAAEAASPAPLRIALNPAREGVQVTILKRRGPQCDTPLVVPLTPSPILLNRHATLDRRASASPRPRIVPASLVDVATALAVDHQVDH